MWTPAARAELVRESLPYATTLERRRVSRTRAAPACPVPIKPPPTLVARAVLDTILYVPRSGCAKHNTYKFTLCGRTYGIAEHRAVIASLIETRTLASGEQRAYLAEAIIRSVGMHPYSSLNDLPPWGYPAASAAKAAT